MAIGFIARSFTASLALGNTGLGNTGQLRGSLPNKSISLPNRPTATAQDAPWMNLTPSGKALQQPLATVYAENTWPFTDSQLKEFDYSKVRLAASFLISDANGNTSPWTGLTRLTDLQSQMKHQPGEWVVSLGGATDSHIGTAISSTTARANLVNSIKTYVDAHPFIKGIDIDWEFPKTPSEKTALTQFVQALRTKMGDSFTISIAVSPAYYLNYYDFPALNPLVNQYNYMGYDFGSASQANGPIDPRNSAGVQQTLWIAGADHSIPFSVSGALTEMIRLGADTSKIVANFPAYCGDSSDSSVSRKHYADVYASLNLETRPVDPDTKEVIIGDTTCPSTESYRQKIVALNQRFNITQFGMWELGYDTAALPLMKTLVTEMAKLNGNSGTPTLSPTASPTSTGTSWLSPVVVAAPSLCDGSTTYTCVASRVTYGNNQDAALKAQVMTQSSGVNFTQSDLSYYSREFANVATPGGALYGYTQVELQAISQYNEHVASITINAADMQSASVDKVKTLFANTVPGGSIQEIPYVEQTTNSSKPLSTADIIMIIVGCAVGGALLLYCLICRNKTTPEAKYTPTNQQDPSDTAQGTREVELTTTQPNQVSIIDGVTLIL